MEGGDIDGRVQGGRNGVQSFQHGLRAFARLCCVVRGIEMGFMTFGSVYWGRTGREGGTFVWVHLRYR